MSSSSSAPALRVGQEVASPPAPRSELAAFPTESGRPQPPPPNGGGGHGGGAGEGSVPKPKRQATPAVASAAREESAEAKQRAAAAQRRSKVMADSGAAAVASQVAARMAASAKPLPYPHSEASSARSAWMKSYKPDAANSMTSRGLMSNDISRSTECCAGVCVLRQHSLPDPPKFGSNELQYREATRALHRAIRRDAEAKAEFEARGPNKAGPAGAGGTILPRQQEKTAGQPSICRPMQVPETELLDLAMADDSMPTTESRARFWWKPITEDVQREVKKHGRLRDSWKVFRDMAELQSNTMRSPFKSF